MREPEFKVKEVLYYVNPFVFIIDKVFIEFIDEEDANQNIYYIDHSGAYLLEEHLFRTLDGAKARAEEMLEKFYIQHKHNIHVSNPELDFDPED